MKNFSILISILPVLLVNLSYASDIDAIYSRSLDEYNAKNYGKASELFDKILKKKNLDGISSDALYNGACIYALNKSNKTALDLLQHLANKRFYSNLGHITTDTDLKNIYGSERWHTIINQVTENKKTLPKRKRSQIYSELTKAKKILEKDSGKLWNENIWSDDILVLDYDNIIYSLTQLPNSKTEGEKIFQKNIPENTLGFSCSSQSYQDKEYAIVLANYLDDESSTIIHELFHIMQSKHKQLNGEPIVYLDNYDARQWLRLEYQALRNALHTIDDDMQKSVVEMYTKHAMLFRKLRQTKYKQFRTKEIEIETQEGLANYTGFVLSTYPNKIQKAIDEINQREQAESYTRPFAYATGPAYGMIFDYLGIKWRVGLDVTYDFLQIFEDKYLHKFVDTSSSAIKEANKFNNYDEIHQQETDREIDNDKLISFYTDIFVDKPTLTVKIIGSDYGRTFDMNGMMVLKDIGIVYSRIKGRDNSGNNFGNFSTIKDKEKLGVSGVLYAMDGLSFTFPLPRKINGKKIFGKYYSIDLNKGWEVVTINKKGDLEIVKTKK